MVAEIERAMRENVLVKLLGDNVRTVVEVVDFEGRQNVDMTLFVEPTGTYFKQRVNDASDLERLIMRDGGAVGFAHRILSYQFSSLIFRSSQIEV